MMNTKEEIAKLSKGYYGRRASRSIFKNAQGQKVFFYWYNFKLANKGQYLIDSDETELRLRKKLIQYHRSISLRFYIIIISLVFCFAYFKSSGFSSSLFYVGIVLAALFYGLFLVSGYKKLFQDEVKKLTPALSDQPVKRQDVMPKIMKRYSNAQLLISFLVCVYLVWDKAKMLHPGVAWDPFVILQIVLFTVGALFIGRIFILKNEKWF